MEEERTCPNCGTKLFHNVNKISKKTGKPYTNWNCPKCDFVEFVDTNKVAAKEIDTAKNMGMPEVLNPKWQGFFDKVDEIADTMNNIAIDIEEIKENTPKIEK